MFRDMEFVSAKGCFDRTLDPTEICVNLREVTNVLTRKSMFYCRRDFPRDCSKFGCPKMLSISEKWRRDLKKIENYE